ncbi:MAG: hypothetical protein PHX10_14450, partial [Gallionellaceae bacterium]|nr:hypothetical protein [Gallionellaceae bacterium]
MPLVKAQNKKPAQAGFLLSGDLSAVLLWMGRNKIQGKLSHVALSHRDGVGGWHWPGVARRPVTFLARPRKVTKRRSP